MTISMLMVTGVAIHEDSDSKHSDRVRSALRTMYPEVKEINSHVVAYPGEDTPQERAQKIIADAQTRGHSTIVLYRDTAKGVQEELLKLFEQDPEAPTLLSWNGTGLVEAA